MNYVIGDLHGEITKLRRLVETIRRRDAHPEFIFIGDYVDKGEDSLATLRYLQELSQRHRCVFLLGNHDFFWKYFSLDPVRHTDFLLKYGGLKTQRDFGTDSIPQTVEKLLGEFAALVDSWSLSWESEKFLVTHSGLTREAYLRPVGEFTPQDVLFNRFDFLATGQSYHGKRIVFGHTAFFSLYSDGAKIGIDTGACYAPDYPLSALCLDDEMVLDSRGAEYALGGVSRDVFPCIIRHKPITDRD